MNPVRDHRAGPGRRRLAAELAAPLLAALLLLAGLVLALLPARSEDIGWFAYAPLSQQTFHPPGLVMLGAEA